MMPDRNIPPQLTQQNLSGGGGFKEGAEVMGSMPQAHLDQTATPAERPPRLVRLEGFTDAWHKFALALAVILSFKLSPRCNSWKK